MFYEVMFSFFFINKWDKHDFRIRLQIICKYLIKVPEKIVDKSFLQAISFKK